MIIKVTRPSRTARRPCPPRFAQVDSEDGTIRQLYPWTDDLADMFRPGQDVIFFRVNERGELMEHLPPQGW